MSLHLPSRLWIQIVLCVGMASAGLGAGGCGDDDANQAGVAKGGAAQSGTQAPAPSDIETVFAGGQSTPAPAASEQKPAQPIAPVTPPPAQGTAALSERAAPIFAAIEAGKMKGAAHLLENLYDDPAKPGLQAMLALRSGQLTSPSGVLNPDAQVDTNAIVHGLETSAELDAALAPVMATFVMRTVVRDLAAVAKAENGSIVFDDRVAFGKQAVIDAPNWLYAGCPVLLIAGEPQQIAPLPDPKKDAVHVAFGDGEVAQMMRQYQQVQTVMLLGMAERMHGHLFISGAWVDLTRAAQKLDAATVRASLPQLREISSQFEQKGQYASALFMKRHVHWLEKGSEPGAGFAYEWLAKWAKTDDQVRRFKAMIAFLYWADEFEADVRAAGAKNDPKLAAFFDALRSKSNEGHVKFLQEVTGIADVKRQQQAQAAAAQFAQLEAKLTDASLSFDARRKLIAEFVEAHRGSELAGRAEAYLPQLAKLEWQGNFEQWKNAAVQLPPHERYEALIKGQESASRQQREVIRQLAKGALDDWNKTVTAEFERLAADEANPGEQRIAQVEKLFGERAKLADGMAPVTKARGDAIERIQRQVQGAAFRTKVDALLAAATPNAAKLHAIATLRKDQKDADYRRYLDERSAALQKSIEAALRCDPKHRAGVMRLPWSMVAVVAEQTPPIQDALSGMLLHPSAVPTVYSPATWYRLGKLLEQDRWTVAPAGWVVPNRQPGWRAKQSNLPTNEYNPFFPHGLRRVLHLKHEDTGLTFALVPAGTFMLEQGKMSSVKTLTSINAPFLLCTTELTQAVWAKTQLPDPSKVIGADLPVHNLKWDDAKAGVEKLGFALPTEAQMKIAAADQFAYEAEYCYDFIKPEQPIVQPVAKLKHNALGLYDVFGNAAEWCADGEMMVFKSQVVREWAGSAITQRKYVVAGSNRKFVNKDTPGPDFGVRPAKPLPALPAGVELEEEQIVEALKRRPKGS